MLRRRFIVPETSPVIRKNIRSWLETRAALRDFKEPSSTTERLLAFMRAGLSRLRILGDLVHFLCLGLRSRTSLAAENLFLRKQPAFYQERKGQASPGRQSDPFDVGAAQPLVQLAGRPDRREADDLHRLAPQGLPPLLALEV